jgi:hypothetical protein
MARVHNFCAGPAALPEAVLERAAAELLDWHGSGMSFMEMSHRSKAVVDVVAEAEASLRRLLRIGDEFAVLFTQGGASAQFSAVPLNLARSSTAFDYLNTGQWSRKAMKEASRYGDVREVAASSGAPVICLRGPTGHCARTPPTCITRPTRPSTASSFTMCPRSTCLWWRTCPRRCCRALCRSIASM